MYSQETFIKQFNMKTIIVFCLFMGLVCLSFIPIWSSLGFSPDFMVMMLYLWLVYRPDLIQFPILSVIGIIQDGLYGDPLGIAILEIMLLFLFTRFLKRFILHKSFGFIFAGYVAYLLAYSLMEWFILSCFKHEWLSLIPTLKATVFSILVYPVVCSLSLSIQKHLDLPVKG